VNQESRGSGAGKIITQAFVSSKKPERRFYCETAAESKVGVGGGGGPIVKSIPLARRSTAASRLGRVVGRKIAFRRQMPTDFRVVESAKNAEEWTAQFLNREKSPPKPPRSRGNLPWFKYFFGFLVFCCAFFILFGGSDSNGILRSHVESRQKVESARLPSPTLEEDAPHESNMAAETTLEQKNFVIISTGRTHNPIHQSIKAGEIGAQAEGEATLNLGEEANEHNSSYDAESKRLSGAVSSIGDGNSGIGEPGLGRTLGMSHGGQEEYAAGARRQVVAKERGGLQKRKTVRSEESEAPCSKCLTRAEQLRLGSRDFVPLFVKFHKVGSGTVSELFRRHCGSVARRLNTSSNVYPWRGGPSCGPGPHEHVSLEMYHSGGVQKFEECTEKRSPVRLYTLLRDPVEKFLSGSYFWRREVPIHLANKLNNSPGNVTAKDMDALAESVFKYGAPRSGRAGPLLQYTHVLARLPDHRRDNPSEHDIQAACARLRNDMTVGTTENIDSLVVLIALENGWPLEEMCYFNSHVNKARPREGAFKPQVLGHLRRVLRADEKVVECAREAHLAQATNFPNFTQALNLFSSQDFKQRCEQIKERSVREDARRGKKAVRARKAEACEFSFLAERRRERAVRLEARRRRIQER